MSIARPSWVQIALLSIASVVLSWVFTGCRLGNRVVTPPPPPEPAPGISGYYLTAPNISTTYYCMNSIDTPCKTSTDVLDIPGLILNVMSSPVGYVVQDAKSGSGRIFNAVSGNEENFRLNLRDPKNPDTGELHYGESTNSVPLLQAPLWTTDYGCNTSLILVQDAKLNRYPKYDRSHVSGLILSGTIEYTAKFYRTIEDVTDEENCIPALQLLTTCYQSSAQCGTNDAGLAAQRHAFARDLFEPYIRMGAMTESDIILATVLAYEVNYR